MKCFVVVFLACIGAMVGGDPAYAGHGVVYTPSYYPHEIAVETVHPASAPERLEKNTLHAYIGATPVFSEAIPEDLKSIESLEALLVLRFNRDTEKLENPERRCAAADDIVAGFDDPPADTVIHPYPVTPFHADYLQHVDRVEEAKAKVQSASATNRTLKFRVIGERARALLGTRWSLVDADWDVSLEEVPVGRLVSSGANGWLGPPWMKDGWFLAYRLLGPTLVDADTRRSADALYRRLTNGEYGDEPEKLNLQRRLLMALTRECVAVVVGHTLRREYYNGGYSGVENISFDSQAGLSSPVFLRTVKLKDFPWNGWLYLGVDEKADAAWNPVAGFSDPPGMLIWSALGDPALLPFPYGDSWIANRVEPEVFPARASSRIPVPGDALIPQPGTGELKPVGKGRTSAVSITYRVPMSRFHDNTESQVSDLLYSYAFAYRWGVGSDGERAYDVEIDAATALLRERLVGVKVVDVRRGINEIAPDIKVARNTAIVDVYLDHAPEDSMQVAALAPPWSAVPWHLLALMEAAVERGEAAFSSQEAKRRHVPWLDVVRNPSTRDALGRLADEFESSGYRPAVLKDRVTADEARARWSALKAFARSKGHYLVTNGPYQLKEWSDAAYVVQVVRELTYPHGVGSFNYYADVPRAVITNIERAADRILIDVDVEMDVREQRSYRTVRQHLTRQTMRGLYLVKPDSRYVLLGPDGSVVQAGAAVLHEDGRFEAELPQHLPRGRYTFLVAVDLDGNAVNSSNGILSFEAT